jgi:DNA modification methylase
MEAQILNTVQNGDALELMKKLDDHSVDLTILDPDYQYWDELCENGIIDQAIRVTKKTGNIICFTKQPFDFKLRNTVNHIFRREMIWSFTNGGAWVSNKLPLVSFQKIFWLTPSKDSYIDVRTGRSYDKNTKTRKRNIKIFGGYKEDGKMFVPSEEGTWIRDHYHFNKPDSKKLLSKPTELMEIMIKCFCPENGIVLDPFFAEGNTGNVCSKLNRNFIGIEQKKKRLKRFNKRFYNRIPGIMCKKIYNYLDNVEDFLKNDINTDQKTDVELKTKTRRLKSDLKNHIKN